MNTASVPVHPARRAFTLIELLTVIAIIGILAAIIIPTVGRVRGSAKSAQCLSNLRQINMAVSLYVEDNKGFLPAANRDKLPTESGTGTTVSWAKEMSRYLPLRGTSATAGEHPIFVCGSAEFNGKSGRDLNMTYTTSAAILGLNSAGMPTDSKQRRLLRSVDSSRLSFIPLIMEGKAQSATALGSYPNITWSTASQDMGVAGYEATRSFDFRHNGRLNACFMDGSVRAMDFAKFKTLDERTYSGLTAN